MNEAASTTPDSCASLDCIGWLLRAWEDEVPKGTGSLCRANGGTTAPIAAWEAAAAGAAAAAGLESSSDA